MTINQLFRKSPANEGIIPLELYNFQVWMIKNHLQKKIYNNLKLLEK